MRQKYLIPFYTVMILSIPQMSFSQTDTINALKMKSIVRNFFIDEGQIDSINKLDVAIFDVIDGSELADYKESIYIIRVEYRTDGKDYLLFKNRYKYEILDFSNFKNVINKVFDFFPNESDERLSKYIAGLNKWYEDYLYVKNSRRQKYKVVNVKKN